VQSLQERYAPDSICFGCGPANAKGLHIRSFVEGDEVIARFQAEPHHAAFAGVLSGGIIGTLLDCHCNWAAAYELMRAAGVDAVPPTVTADYAVTLRRPTPVDVELMLRARPVSREGRRCVVEGTLEAAGKVCATCRGTFVAVEPGHPAYHRW
jgi:acyl-coenzyme A thioesterase PaaI-like protein